jgi:argininosuccinate lyase
VPTVGVGAAIFDEHDRILCVKQDYGGKRWALPGGAMEAGESPIQAVEREVREETGCVVRVGHLIGLYARPATDDLWLCFAATVLDRGPWEPSGEIAAVGFFGCHDLPEPMSFRMQRRIRDAFAGRQGVVHVFDEEDSA